MLIQPYVAYPILVLTGIIGAAIGNVAGTQSTVNTTLKLCNQKPLECETGKIPYTEAKPTQTKPAEKK
jgi:hypothetical protein